MPALLISSVVVSACLVGAAYAARTHFRPRVTFRGGVQKVGRTRVFDGGVEVVTRNDEGACLSGYICYIRRARQKDGLPTVAP